MKHFLPIFLLVAATLLPSGCRKELTPASTDRSSLRQTTCTYEVTTVCGGTVLAFPTLQAYDYAYNCLYDDYELWNDQFDALHANLSEDDLNDLIDATGWNEEQPLIDFETNQGVTSLRSKLRTDEQVWLATGTFDPLSDPNNHFVDDPVEQALLSDQGLIMIGSEIHVYRADGSIYRITNGDCNLALSVAADPASVVDPNVVVVAAAATTSDECLMSTENNSDTIWGADPNKKYKWYVRYKKGFSQSKACAKIVNYRRKSNTSNWRLFRTLCDVEVSGYARDQDSCGQQQAIDVGCPRTLLQQNYCAPKKRNRRTGTSYLTRFAKIKRDDIVGYFDAGGTVTRRYLTW